MTRTLSASSGGGRASRCAIRVRVVTRKSTKTISSRHHRPRQLDRVAAVDLRRLAVRRRRAARRKRTMLYDEQPARRSTKIAAQMPSTSSDSTWMLCAGGECGSKMLGTGPGAAAAHVGTSRLASSPSARLASRSRTPHHNTRSANHIRVKVVNRIADDGDTATTENLRAAVATGRVGASSAPESLPSTRNQRSSACRLDHSLRAIPGPRRRGCGLGHQRRRRPGPEPRDHPHRRYLFANVGRHPILRLDVTRSCCIPSACQSAPRCQPPRSVASSANPANRGSPDRSAGGASAVPDAPRKS